MPTEPHLNGLKRAFLGGQVGLLRRAFPGGKSDVAANAGTDLLGSPGREFATPAAGQISSSHGQPSWMVGARPFAESACLELFMRAFRRRFAACERFYSGFFNNVPIIVRLGLFF